MSYGIEGAFYTFQYPLECLTQKTPSVNAQLLELSKEHKNRNKEVGLLEMEDKQTALWSSVCPLLDGFEQLLKLPYDSVGEHDTKADIALVLSNGVYLVQLKTHQSDAVLHSTKKCKILVDYEWKAVQTPPAFWCDTLPTRLELLKLLLKFGFKSERFTFVKQAYPKLSQLRGKEVFPRTLQKNMGPVVDDLITLGLIRQRRDGTWTVI